MSGSIATEAEFALIDLIRGMVHVTRSDVVLGIGDDGAITRIPDGHDLVTVTDTMVAGVHFPNDATPFDIGWKALAVNLSRLRRDGRAPRVGIFGFDLAECGSILVRGRIPSGFAALAKQHHVALIGGDTTRGPIDRHGGTVQALVTRASAQTQRCA